MTALTEEMTAASTELKLTRRAFVKAGGALVVSLGLPMSLTAGSTKSRGTGSPTDPTQLSAWLEIRGDGSIVARTSRTEIGTGMSAYYAQMIAEELRVEPDVISLVMGDTDATPDFAFSAGLMFGAINIRKVAAYTYQALLGLASEKLGVPATDLSVRNGIVSGGDGSISYQQLVEHQELNLTIPVEGSLARIDPSQDSGLGGLRGFTVTGNPPLKPASEYEFIGKSYPMPGIPDMVTGKTVWAGDVRLPKMLHARMVRPTTLGSTLVEVGPLDEKRFPTAQVVVEGNLVAVLSPDEWEALRGARAVASQTRWSEWAGLPGSDDLTRALRSHPWKEPTASRGDAAAVAAGLEGAAKTLQATYEQPYVKHAPIGPFVATADVHADGKATIWTHSAHSHGLRVRIANTLGTAVENVVVRWRPGSGQYGRTTYGGDGADADAAILSQRVGQPVRVQWTLEEDLAWSSASPGWVADLQAGLDAEGKLVAVQSHWYSPHSHDGRLLGGVLAGRPSAGPRTGARVSTVWPYDAVQVNEQVFAMPNIGADAPSDVGLRGNIMRTPQQRQQSFPLESMINEAAALAGTDPIEFRLQHTTEARLREIIEKTARSAGWEPRPSPSPAARKSGDEPVVGRGVGVLIRTGGYWAGIAEVSVTPSTGQVKVTKFTLGLDCGKIINPRQLARVMQGGLVMGLGETLKEELTFDRSRVTSTSWNHYQIPTMQDLPEIGIVTVSSDDRDFGLAGEAPNALAPAAVVAAFFDATGVQPRRIPLSPEYVRSLLGA